MRTTHTQQCVHSIPTAIEVTQKVSSALIFNQVDLYSSSPLSGMLMSYRPITRNGMAMLYSLVAVGINVMLMSVLLPGTNTHGLLAICK